MSECVCVTMEEREKREGETANREHQLIFFAAVFPRQSRGSCGRRCTTTEARCDSRDSGRLRVTQD